MTAVAVVGLGTALAVTGVQLRGLRAEHADLVETRRRICNLRLLSLEALVGPQKPDDRENRAIAEYKLDDFEVTSMCLGMRGSVNSSNAELCWILAHDDPRAGHCFDALFDGMYFLYRFRFGSGYPD